MYSIIYKLLKYAEENTELYSKIKDMSEESKKKIKVKINRQELENLINPKEGKYNTDIKDIYFDPDN